jgi:hypothetical protein
MPSWKKVITSGSDASFNSVYVSSAVTASIFSGSFVGDGAGLTNLQYGEFATASFTSLATWSFSHNLGYQYVAVEVYDSNNFIVIPSEIKLINSNSAEIRFTSPQSGTALATLGTGVVTNYVTVISDTSSLLVTASATDNVITFTKGNGSQFDVTVNAGSINLSAYTTTASFNTYTGSISSKFAGTASLAETASFVTGSIFSGSNSALSASFATSSSFATSASFATSSSQAISSSFSTSSSFASTASFITGSRVIGTVASSSYALSSSYTTFAETASSATNAQDILVYVLNNSGYDIAKGVVVHITASGNSSDIPRIVTASYENDANSANTLGITNQAVPHTSGGYVMTEGVLKGINTTNFQSGQLIYLGATGSIIGSAPQAPLHSVRLGQVVREQQNEGSIYVSINNGYEIDELHDVRITSASLSYGDLLMHSGSVWINSKQLSGSYGLTGSLNVNGSITGSFTGSLTGSLFGTASFSTSSSFAISSSFARTASFASTASFINILNQDVILTGSLTVTNNLTVLGSSSIQYITSSQLNIEDNIISVNTITPAIRFGGLTVIDSGSNPQQSGSLLFDSQNNQWIFVHQNTPGSTVTSSMLLMGPQTFNNVGNETALGANRLPKSSPAEELREHLIDSNITDNGSVVSINSNTQITGSLLMHNGAITGSLTGSITGALTGTASFATSASQAITASFASTASFVNPLQQTVFITGSARITGSMLVTGSINLTGSLSASAFTITTQPTSSYTTRQILMRNSASGQIEITDSTSPAIYNFGMSYAMTTFNYLT